MADAVRTSVTEDDLMALGADARVEVIDGEMVEMSPVGGLHHVIAGRLYFVLETYVRASPIGAVFMDGLIFLLHREGHGLRGARVPDVSFVRLESIPADWDLQRPFPGAPTLAVEVMSPDDEAEDMLRRIRDYLNAGTEQIWVVYPTQKEVHQYRHDSDPETVRIYKGDDALDADALLPGLRVIISDLFALPRWAAP